MICVTGGTYVERCIQPRWNQLFGSGGRAAAALSALCEVELVTYIDDGLRGALDARASAFGNIAVKGTAVPRTLSFDYVHPLSTPIILPRSPALGGAAPLQVKGDLVLRFGMLEGETIVDAERAIYDPQSATAPAFFGENGSRAKTLAVVANAQEISLLTGVDDVVAGARQVLDKEKAEVVVVKRGALGAMVLTATSCQDISAYRTELVFSIGSGDVFAAAFAYFWGLEKLAPPVAADLASKATARYCESRSPVLLPRAELEALSFRPVKMKTGRAYLAAPFFCLSERWLVEEARAHLLGMKLDVFSPLHDVGSGPADIVAPADIAALNGCDRMLALLDGADPGTIFEVGYARAKGIPVVALSQTLTDEQLKMVVGSGCTHVDDFATAIYLTAWQ